MSFAPAPCRSWQALAIACAAFATPASPIVKVRPPHLWALHNRVQRILSPKCLVGTGTPNTGTMVWDASIPGKCAAPPRTGDDRANTALVRFFGVVKHVVGHAVCGDDFGLKRHARCSNISACFDQPVGLLPMRMPIITEVLRLLYSYDSPLSLVQGQGAYRVLHAPLRHGRHAKSLVYSAVLLIVLCWRQSHFAVKSIAYAVLCSIQRFEIVAHVLLCQ